MAEVVYCGCLGKYQRRNRVHHLNTKKHCLWLETQDVIEAFASIHEDNDHGEYVPEEDIILGSIIETKEEEPISIIPATPPPCQFSFGIPCDSKRIFIDFNSRTLVITTEGANGPANLKICVECEAVVV